MGIEPKEAREQRQEEYDAARKVGAAAELVTGVPLKGFEKAPVLRYPNQATFHPLRYLRGVAKAIREQGRSHLRQQRRDRDRGTAGRRSASVH